MTNRMDEIGVAGYLSDADRDRLRDFDVDAFHSIGLAGALTPEQVLLVAEAGVATVASVVHEMGIAGPVTPEQLEGLVRVGPERVRDLLLGGSRSPIRPEDLDAVLAQLS